MLAALADRVLPAEATIDLINVAFIKEEGGNTQVPDRVTGLQGKN